MMKKILGSFLLLSMWFYSVAQTKYDVCVYGGTSAGVIAAYTAKKMGKRVLLIEPGRRLGGLTSGGLGYTDIGNKYAISGVALDFYRRMGKLYGSFEQWIFEPSKAEKIFQSYIQSAAVPVLYQYRLADVKKENGLIKSIVVEQSGKPQKSTNKVITATEFIDCSYEGDLMAKAGVSYIVGREANSQYGETYDGVQLREKHQFPDGIDPYKVPGDPNSGLLWGISNETLAAHGAGDKKVQSYNFRICLTNDPANRIPITRPADYDSTHYELLLRYINKIQAKDLGAFLKFDRMPNHKTDINNNGPFSTDMIGMNYNYPDADYATREKIFRDHENYNKGLLYFIGHDHRMPQHLREQILEWGYPKDEYVNNGHWSPQMYVREARRMIGDYVMTQANCEGREVVNDGIGMAAYTMDSHNCERLVVNGMVKNEGDVQIGGFGPYPISYRALIPKREECKNLLVPVCLSATHIAYGSIRMEPVFMVLGQSAAVAAVYAANAHEAVQDVNVPQVKQFLKTNPLVDGSMPDVVIDDADQQHVQVSGNWKKETRGCYGPSMLVAADNNGTQSVHFQAPLKKSGRYAVYTYLPKLQGMAADIPVVIYDGQQKHEQTIKPYAVKVEGQTSGEWVFLGNYQFAADKKPYIELSNKDANGVVAADAVLLTKEK